MSVEVTDHVHVSGTNMFFSFEFKLRNVGNSPALGVYLVPIIVDRFSSKPPVREFVNNVFMAAMNREGVVQGYTIAPDDERVYRTSCGFQQDAFKTATNFSIQAPLGNDLSLIRPMLVGFIAYASVHSRKAHTTTFYYDITRKRHIPQYLMPGAAFIQSFDESFIAMDEIRLEESMSPASEMT